MSVQMDTPDPTMSAVAMLDSIPSDQPDFLVDVEVDQPTPGPHDVLVKIEAVSINPDDTKVLMRAGKQKPPEIL